MMDVGGHWNWVLSYIINKRIWRLTLCSVDITPVPLIPDAAAEQIGKWILFLHISLWTIQFIFLFLFDSIRYFWPNLSRIFTMMDVIPSPLSFTRWKK